MTQLSKLSWFYDKVKTFHKTAVKYLLKYFCTALASPILDCFTALSPSKQSHLLTARKLKNLANKYSKVVKNIDACDGMDKIFTEIDQYQLDEDVKVLDKTLKYEDYWSKVANLELGSSGWKKYEVLPLFAVGLAVKFISNSEVERKFSLMNNIFQNKQRNQLSQDSLNSLLHIKSGIECKENRKGCKKCLTKTVHCHCCSFEITQQIREECKRSKGRHEEYLKVVSESKEQLEEERLKIRERIEKEIKEIKEVRKTKLSNSSQFCSPAHLEPLYEKNENKKTVVKNAAPPQSGTAPHCKSSSLIPMGN